MAPPPHNLGRSVIHDLAASVVGPFTPTRPRPGQRPEKPKNDICLKVFVIFVVVIGAVGMGTGALSFLVSQGVPIQGLGSLASIGPVNSGLMLGVGFFLFAVGSAAWTCHLRKEQIDHENYNDYARRHLNFDKA